MGAIAPDTRWSLADDLLLVNAVEAGATLESLSKGAVRFSLRYTVQELHDRWHSLLYDPVISIETSALMFEYERNSLKTQEKASKSDGTKDTKSRLRKRKSESIRTRYYAMRKMTSKVSLAGDLCHSTLLPLEGNILSTVNNCKTENYGQLNELPVPDLLKSEGLEVKQSTVLNQDNDSEVPITYCETSFHNLGYPSPMSPAMSWDAMEGTSTLNLPHAVYGGNGDYKNDTLRSSRDVDNPDTLGSSVMQINANLNKEMSSSGPETDIAGIIAQLNKFMDCTDPDDIPDTVDEYYIDTFSNLLVDYPNEDEGEITCPSVTMISTEGYTDLASVEKFGESSDKNSNYCSIDWATVYYPVVKEKLLSSAPSMDPDFPELRSGALFCKLNTEDRVIPDNDDVFLPVCMPIQPLSYLSDWEFDKAPNPVSSSIMNIPTHQRASRDLLLRERSGNEIPHLSSGRMRSSFPTHQKGRKEGDHMMKRGQIDNERTHTFSYCMSSSFQNHDKATPGGGIMTEREQIDRNSTQVMISSVQTPQNISHQAMLMINGEDPEGTGTNQTHITSSWLQPIASSNHAVSICDGNLKLKHIYPRSDNLINVNENDQINQLNCTNENENENDSGGLYIKENVIHLNQTKPQNYHPVNSSVESHVTGHNHVLGCSRIVDANPRNKNSAVLHSGIFSHEELDTSELVAPDLEKDVELLIEECPDDGDVPCFSDVEAMILDTEFSPNDVDSDLSETESRHPNEKLIRTMLRLEQAARTSSHRMMQACGAFSALYSRHSRYLIKKPEVLIGRTADDVQVDIDLSTERCGNKISRRQAIIKVNDDGDILLTNLGKASIYVNGGEVARRQSQYLTSSCLIEVKEVTFLFATNPARVKRYIKEEICKGSKMPKQEIVALE